jgi:Integrase core domain
LQITNTAIRCRSPTASRYLLTCEALSSTREDYAFTVFERLFRERGLPANIRSDNGVPFASAHALFNLSKLAVWWLRLGIGIERIKLGHPQQNGPHERMHLTLKKEATKPAAANFLQQQARFDKFIDVFNNQRAHEALAMQCPAEVYQPSTHGYSGLPDIDYQRRARFDPKEAGALGGEGRKLAPGKRVPAGEVSSRTGRENAARSGVLASAR